MTQPDTTVRIQPLLIGGSEQSRIPTPAYGSGWWPPSKASAPDARWRSIRADQAKALDKDIQQYAAAVRRGDGPERWDRILAASQQWLDEMDAAGQDPVPVLARRNRGASAPGKHRRRKSR